MAWQSALSLEHASLVPAAKSVRKPSELLKKYQCAGNYLLAKCRQAGKKSCILQESEFR
jgi:hypothetical protein